MKFTHWILIFFVILLSIALPTFFRTNITAKTEQMNNNYSNYLIAASKSALDSAAEDSKSNTSIFASEQTRQKAVDTFYKTLVQCFNYDYTTYAPIVKNYVPCIVLVDNDGFYIEYGEDRQNADGTYEVYDIISPIHKWSRSYSPGASGNVGHEFYVEFHLDDTISVVYLKNNEDPVQYSGNYKDVYDQLHRDGISLGSMINSDSIYDLEALLSNYKTFYNEKKDVIIAEVQRQLEYYINTKTEVNNPNGRYQYQFTLPRVTGQDWARMVDGPTILSFMQGAQTQYGTYKYNVYALAGAEVEYDYVYYISPVDGTDYYHLKGCQHLDESKMSRGYSMEKAASLGAYPCPDCIH